MNWFPGCLGRRASYFAYFAADGKELALDRVLAAQIICFRTPLKSPAIALCSKVICAITDEIH